jgi:hypothetical protein
MKVIILINFLSEDSFKCFSKPLAEERRILKKVVFEGKNL